MCYHRRESNLHYCSHFSTSTVTTNLMPETKFSLSPFQAPCTMNIIVLKVTVKVIPQQAEVAQGVPGRLRPLIFSTFGTTRVVGRQPYTPAAFTPGEIPGTHFQRLRRPQSTWFCRWEPRKKSLVTPPGIDPGTVRIVAQCLNHYTTAGPI